MEAEKAEASKRYNNPFLNVLYVVKVVAVVALLGYWCLPAIVNQLQEVTVWFSLVLRNLFLVFVIVNALIVLIYVSFSKTTEKNKPDLYDEYYAAVPTVVRASPEYNYYRVTEVQDEEYNHSNYKEIVPAYQSVNVVKESNCVDREVVEVMNSKGYRRMRSEKKTEKVKVKKKVEYRRTESERVTKTASWRSQTMDGLSSEEFQMTVETFITEKKKTLLRENGVVDHWRNGVPDQWQNGVVNNYWQNSVPERLNGVPDQWQNGVVNNYWQNGVPERQNGVIQWQRSRDDGTGCHRHRSRSDHRLVGGSGSTGSGSYLAISN